MQKAPRFLIAGGISTVVTIGLFNLLAHAGTRPILGSLPLVAYAIAMALGLGINYAGNKYWVFGAIAPTKTRGTEILQFGLTNVIAIAIPSICLAVSRYMLGLNSVLADNVSANVIGLMLATASRWFAYRYLVFAGDPAAARRQGLGSP
jgi:putative flippase GtrA